MKAEEIDNFEELLDAAESSATKDWDVDFVSDLRDRYDKFGDNLYVTDAQLEQLERIAG
jgi:hypothetical protein